jgi:L-fuconolactonase
MIDAHLHLWDPAEGSYPWLADLPMLRRAYGPTDFDPGGRELDAVVFVEAGRGAGDPLAEVTRVEEIAAGWPLLAGIVAHAPLEAGPRVAPLLDRLAEHSLVKGIRRNLQDEAPGFALSDGFLVGVGLLARHGFVADICIRSWQIPEVTELARSAPHVTFVLDHLGKPDIRAGRWQPWADDLSRLAELGNVVAKLSGLTTEADWTTWTPRQIVPYLVHAINVFGASRCMFGSDWPVSTLAVDYQDWADLVQDAMLAVSPTDRTQILHSVAARVYGLEVNSRL